VTCSWWWRWGESNSTSPVSPARGQRAIGGATCGCSERPVTVTVRQIPLMTAACGTRVAPQAGTTTLAPGGDGSRLVRRVKPVLGNYRLVGKPRSGAAVFASGLVAGCFGAPVFRPESGG
jgi:hypothetical protein